MSSLSCGTPLSILDLPTEILFVIFADEALSPQDLFSLAILCRIFHFIALTLYFSRNGLDPSTRSIQITMRSNRRDLLAALRVALFETSLDRINFIFPHPIASSTSVFPLLEHLQRVEGFLSRRSSVKSVSLELDHVDCSKFSVGSDEALRAWSRAFGDLLNCILKTQCTTLTVTNGCHFADAYQVVEALPLTRRASWLGRLLYWRKAPRRAISAQRAPEFQRWFSSSHARACSQLWKKPPCWSIPYSYPATLAALAQLLTTIIDALARHPCHPMLALALIPVSHPVQQGEMEPDVRASLDCVQGLEFTISPNLIDKFIGNVVLWVAVFRRVKGVAIRVEPQADVGTLPQRLASSIAGTEFLRAIEVNGMEHPLLWGHEQTVKICHKVLVILQDFGVHSTLFGLLVCSAGLAFTQLMEITGVGGAVPQRFVFPSPDSRPKLMEQIIDELESSSSSVVCDFRPSVCEHCHFCQHKGPGDLSVPIS
ncbi:hypothetical protein DFH06DRAFT_1141356 [Mycena polygramma]|nr:hypothetical protein DFH06DRAFT_1141356 [Mycena polygramma]